MTCISGNKKWAALAQPICTALSLSGGLHISPATFLGSLRLRFGASRLNSLKPVVKIGVFALALFLSALPTMACLLPTVTLSAAEHECCQRMASDCGSANMPSSHSCCQRTGPEASSYVKAPSVQLNQTARTTFGLPVDASPLLLLTGLPVFQVSRDFGVHGPPGSPTTISALRI